VRVTAQLVKAADGFHLWSETYDRTLEDIFAVQDDIARSVSSALRLRLLAGQKQPAAPAGNAEAYSLYLQGKYFRARRKREDLVKAVSYFEQALKLDPGYARAWVGLATAHTSQVDHDSIPRDEGLGKARLEVEKALERDPNLAEAHAALGRMRRVYDWDWSGADAAYKRAFELEPRDTAVVLGLASQAATSGRFGEALRLDRRAIEIDPLSVAAHHTLGHHSWRAGRLDEAEAAYRKALDLDPEYPGAHHFLRSTSHGRIRRPRSRRWSRRRSLPGVVKAWPSRITPSDGRKRRTRPWPRFSRETRKPGPSRSPGSTPSAPRWTRPSCGSSGPTPVATAVSLR
jgi:tetratricopeptide (TPR) repeat protein